MEIGGENVHVTVPLAPPGGEVVGTMLPPSVLPNVNPLGNGSVIWLTVIALINGLLSVSVKSTVPEGATLLTLADFTSVGARPHALLATPTSAVCVPVTLGLPHQFSLAVGVCGGECGGNVT